MSEPSVAPDFNPERPEARRLVDFTSECPEARRLVAFTSERPEARRLVAFTTERPEARRLVAFTPERPGAPGVRPGAPFLLTASRSSARQGAMTRAKRCWLMKCEPEAYTIDALARDGVTGWEGVRNYQARNLLRDEMRVGDPVLFYASNADPSGVVGLAEIARAGYPDPLAFKKGHAYHDPKSKKDAPTWYAVDVRFVAKFAQMVTLAQLKETPGLEEMMVTRRGARLSVQPVTAREFAIVRKLGLAAG